MCRYVCFDCCCFPCSCSGWCLWTERCTPLTVKGSLFCSSLFDLIWTPCSGCNLAFQQSSGELTILYSAIHCVHLVTMTSRNCCRFEYLSLSLSVCLITHLVVIESIELGFAQTKKKHERVSTSENRGLRSGIHECVVLVWSILGCGVLGTGVCLAVGDALMLPGVFHQVCVNAIVLSLFQCTFYSGLVVSLSSCLSGIMNDGWVG